MKTKFIANFTNQKTLFGFISTAIYLGFYRQVAFSHHEFQLAGCISFFLAILLWHSFMDNHTAKASRILAFSVLFGIIQFLQIFMTVTIFQMPDLTVIFTHTMLSFFARQYILTGVAGITKSILICMIATYAVKMIWAFFQKNTLIGHNQGQEILIQHDFCDRLDVFAGNSLLFKQKKQILNERIFKFKVPNDGQIYDGAVTIKKYFFNCKTAIKLTIDDKIISFGYFDSLDGFNLLDVFVASFAFIVSFTSLTMLLTPMAPKPTTEAHELLLCTLILIQNITSCCFGAIVSNLFNKFNGSYFKRAQTNKLKLVAIK